MTQVIILIENHYGEFERYILSKVDYGSSNYPDSLEIYVSDKFSKRLTKIKLNQKFNTKNSHLLITILFLMKLVLNLWVDIKSKEFGILINFTLSLDTDYLE